MLTTETTLKTNKFLTSKLKKDFISKMMFNILKLSLGIVICLCMLISILYMKWATAMIKGTEGRITRIILLL